MIEISRIVENITAADDDADWRSDLLAGMMAVEGKRTFSPRSYSSCSQNIRNGTGEPGHQKRGHTHTHAPHPDAATTEPSMPSRAHTHQGSGDILSLFDANPSIEGSIKFTDTASPGFSKPAVGTGVATDGSMMDLMALFDQPDHIFLPNA